MFFEVVNSSHETLKRKGEKNMTKFPSRQAEVLGLVQSIAAGLESNPAVYPAPPVSPADLKASLANTTAKMSEVNATLAAYQMAVEAKDQSMAETVDKAKTCLRYAENTVAYDDDKLKLLGWSGKRKRESLKSAGQVMLLKAVEQGDDWVVLKWKKPYEGGKVAAYEIQRDNDDGKWLNVGTAVVTKAKLIDQPQLVDVRYRIVAINTAGEGPASNTVTVVL